MLEHFRSFAAYNAWANARLYDACDAVSDVDFSADLGAFFGSIEGTLNHLLVGDRIWMARFRGEPAPPIRLDQILFEDRAALRAAREAEDRGVVEWVATLTQERLAETLSYRPVTLPEPVTQPLGPALAHFFNHQTHHRGQCHALLTRLGLKAPSLDLLVFQRER